MVENSIFICPDKVKEQMDDLKNLLGNLGKSNSYIKKGNSKLPVRFSEDAANVKYLDVFGNDLRPVITKKRMATKYARRRISIPRFIQVRYLPVLFWFHQCPITAGFR